METVRRKAGEVMATMATALLAEHRPTPRPGGREVAPVGLPAKRVEYRELHLSQLRLDKYQRDPRPALQAKIAKAPDVALLGALLVSYRDGAWYLLDGQQRVGGLRQAGWREPVSCMVYFGLTYQEEAEIFRKFNDDRSGFTAGEILKAKLEAADPDAWALYDSLGELGLGVALNASDVHSRKDIIKAVAALTRVWRNLGRDRERFKRLLWIIQTAWPEDAQRWNGNIMVGLAMFLLRYEDHSDFSWAELPERLARSSPAKLMVEARELGSLGATDIGTKVGMMILERYNYKRSKKRLPRWWEVPQRRAGKREE